MYRTILKSTNLNFIKRFLFEVKMPALSPTMTSGGIGSWNVKEGDKLKPGNIIASIETDKTAVDFEVQDEFFVGKLLYDVGAQGINVGDTIAIGTEDEAELLSITSKDRSHFLSKGIKENKEKDTPKETLKQEQPIKEHVYNQTNKIQNTQETNLNTNNLKNEGSSRLFISPVMKLEYSGRLKELQQLWDSGFRGSGPDGRIILRDAETLANTLKLNKIDNQSLTQTTTQSTQ